MSSSKEILKKNEPASEVLKRNILVIILIACIAVGIFASSNFATQANIRDIMFSCCIFGILTIGQALVMIVQEIDLSVGSIIAFSPIAALSVIGQISKLFGFQPVLAGGNYVQVDPLVLFIMTIIIAMLIGWGNGLIVVKLRVPSLITTLGMLNTLLGLSYVLSNGYSLYLTKISSVNFLGTYSILGILPLSFLVYIILGVFFIFLLRYTKFGRRIYATGGNAKAANYSGIDTGRWKIIAFSLSGLMAGVATIFYCSRAESLGATQGTGYELTSIAIAVIGGVTLEGGKGSVGGTILAAVILSIILNIMQLLGWVAWYQTIITGLIIVFAALLHTYKEKSKQIQLSEI